MKTRELHYGDNLEVLRHRIAPASVDLVYLDPPFNSKRDYNLLFRSPTGQESDAQITAFVDTWHWGAQAEREFQELLHQTDNSDVPRLMDALRAFLGDSDMLAYLTMMTNRLLELRRVLKPTGSLYLHCDPTASHYLKLVLDAVMGKEFFRSEIIWKRTNVHSDAGTWSNVTDTILYFTKGPTFCWNPQHVPHEHDYVDAKYTHDDQDGRGRYTLGDMTSPNPRPKLVYDWMGYAAPEKGWRYERKTMQRLHHEGRIHYPMRADGTMDTDRRPRLKRFLNEMRGRVLDNVWVDIPPLNSQAAERLGYPTQKPLALLERIILASSNEGDVVLDPFCGCGTAVHAAEKLKRSWIGIDITNLAITLIEKRLKDAFPRISFTVHGVPRDMEGARDLARRDKHHFEWWACSLVNALPQRGRRRGADRGIDGVIFFQDDRGAAKRILVSVKGGSHISVAMVREFKGVLEREQAAMGLFITLGKPTAAMVAEAAAAGFYHSESYHEDWPRLQLLTIEGLLSGQEQPLYKNISPGLGRRAAPRETTAHRGNTELDL